MSISRSLTTRHNEMTRQIILSATLERLEGAPHEELSVRAVARHAGISERTVFRYFAHREELLDAAAEAYVLRLNAPPVPKSTAALAEYAAQLYARFEAEGALTRAVLRSELYRRVQKMGLQNRGGPIRTILNTEVPNSDPRARTIAATLISQALVASTWNAYRDGYDLSAEESLACAQASIAHALNALQNVPEGG